MLNIHDFTNKNDPRPFAHAPFNVEGYTIACDGKTIILSQLKAQYQNNTAAMEAPIKAVIKNHQLGGYQKLPRLLYRSRSCWWCKGKCETECDGCFGKGFIEFIKIEGYFYNKKYVERINDIDTQIKSDSHSTECHNLVGALFFKNKGQFGLIMPMFVEE